MNVTVHTVVLEGEITRAETADVVAELERLAGRGVHDLVVDFGGVTHFDFRGVKTLMRFAEMLRVKGGDVKLAGLSPYVHAIFRSAGANDAFDYLKTVDDAVAFFPHLAPQEMILSNWADAVAPG